MNKLLLATTFAVLGAVSVSAADLPARPYTKAPVIAVDPAYDWSGFYVGGHLGYLWGKTSVVDDGVLTEPGAPTNGVIGGVLAGYNWQSGPLVLGIEGDIGWTNAVGRGLVAIITTTSPNTYDLRWTSHVDGKAGYAVGQPVLTNLNLRLDHDDRIGLLGANGNGKSTFAKLLAGRLDPMAGR